MSDFSPDTYIQPLPRIALQAFCETHDFADVMSRAAQDRHMDKAHVKVQMGGIPAALEAYHNASTPNVLLVEIGGNRDQIIAQLDQLADVCDPGTKVVVVGQVNDIQLYREIVGRGVSDYLTPPLTPLSLTQSLSQLYASSAAKPVGRVVAVLGAKGGVGASTIAHNVAWAFAEQLESDTCIVDMDLAFGTAGLNFNQDPATGIAEAAFAPERVDSALIDRLLAPCTERLHLLAAPATLDRTYDFAPDQFDSIIDGLRGTIPMIVLDIPHMWTSWTRRAMAMADEIIIVVTPDLANLRNARNYIDLLKSTRPNDKPPRVIVNMVGIPKRPEIKIAELAKALECEPTAILPFEPQLFGTAANNGQMIGEIEPEHPIAEGLLTLAAQLAGRSEARGKKTGLLAQLAPLMDRLGIARKRA